MSEKIRINVVIFLFLLVFVSFCWLNRAESPAPDQLSVAISTTPTAQDEAEWESDYPASLLPNERIHINTASQADLERLPSIGATRAENIIAYRTQYGDFETVEALLAVYGIGEEILADITPYITLD